MRKKYTKPIEDYNINVDNEEEVKDVMRFIRFCDEPYVIKLLLGEVQKAYYRLLPRTKKKQYEERGRLGGIIGNSIKQSQNRQKIA